MDQLLRGLPVTARVLMIGAHPDDEDTQLLAWLAREHQVRAAYLSLTRGDGGQNLIGHDLGEALGAIRTEELLAARRIDGADQYFSRAYDFGFSKDAEETFKHWDREAIAGDVVRVIRAFRPHVIVAVFSGTPTDGHGHHQASGILAREAFEAALDTARFKAPTHGQPWRPLKFYRGAWARNAPATMTVQVGEYDPVLGRSPAEIAGDSRSQHRSQGFGALQRRGAAQTRLTRELTRVNESTPATDEMSIFDGVDTSFARLARAAPGARVALDSASSLIGSIHAIVDLRRPRVMVPLLAQLVGQLELAERTSGDADYAASVATIHARAKLALLEAAGIAMETTADAELVAFGDSLPTQVRLYNRGRDTVTIRELTSTGMPTRRFDPVVVLPDSTATFDRRTMGLVDHRPWWIGDRKGAMFADLESPADGIALISYGRPESLVPGVAVAENVRRLSDVSLLITVAGVSTTVSAGEIVYRYADPVLGEQRRPVGGVPPITISLERALEYVPADRPIDRRVRVSVKSHTGRERVLKPRTLVPKGVRVEGLPDSLTLAAGEARDIFVTLKGTLPAGRFEFGVGFESEGTVFAEGFRTIEYPHIRPQRLYRSSAMYLESVPVVVPKGLNVVYVTGVSDASAQSLRQLGVMASAVTPEQLPLLDLTQFTTIVIGPRAYEASPSLRTMNPRLMDWMRAGGTLVVQYGQFEMAEPGMMPFPITFRRPAARVTIENAPVRVLDPQSRLLNWPNRIGERDWANWVQERAVYMPTVIDERYRTPLAMNDPGEPENRGAILEATVGKGRYIYTSLSLFRQIPGGIPGGVRLLVNMISAGAQ
ncbi:MAG TPA: PIG-L family deacetylase [Gemmatimonadaceae bacterium]|nr:PIG-L family deacetylase [Gemmatimonadaceae bacterium]